MADFLGSCPALLALAAGECLTRGGFPTLLSPQMSLTQCTSPVGVLRPQGHPAVPAVGLGVRP